MLLHRSYFKPFAAVLAAGLGLVAGAPSAEAFSPFLVVPEPAIAEASPAYRYANMTNDEAFAELDRRKVLYTRLDSVPGVRAPIRLTGRLHGVYFHSSLPPEQRVTSLFEILDARLALALDDFAAVLERHDIDEVVHFTMYRPNVPARRHDVDDEPRAPASRPRATSVARLPAQKPQVAPQKPQAAVKPRAGLGPKGAIEGAKGAQAPVAEKKQKPGNAGSKPDPGVVHAPAVKKVGSKAIQPAAPAAKGAPARAPAKPASAHPAPARRGAIAARVAQGPMARATPAPPGTRHPAGLAIDVGLVHKRDGRWLSVARHFRGHIGDKTCGDGAKVADDPDAREMRALVCEPSEQGIFTYVLTPNYNAAHVDHYHMEIKPDVRWFLHH